MKTSWNKTRLIDQYFSRQLPDEERLLFDAQLILNSEWREKSYWQRKVYNLIKINGRMQLRTEICKIHDELFSKPRFRGFQNKVHDLFNSPPQ